MGSMGESTKDYALGTIRRILSDVGFSRRDVEDMVQRALTHQAKLPNLAP